MYYIKYSFIYVKFTYLQDVGQPSSHRLLCVGYEGLWILPKVCFILLTNFPLWTEYFVLILSLEESCSRLDSAGKVIPVNRGSRWYSRIFSCIAYTTEETKVDDQYSLRVNPVTLAHRLLRSTWRNADGLYFPVSFGSYGDGWLSSPNRCCLEDCSVNSCLNRAKGQCSPRPSLALACRWYWKGTVRQEGKYKGMFSRSVPFLHQASWRLFCSLESPRV